MRNNQSERPRSSFGYNHVGNTHQYSSFLLRQYRSQANNHRFFKMRHNSNHFGRLKFVSDHDPSTFWAVEEKEKIFSKRIDNVGKTHVYLTTKRCVDLDYIKNKLGSSGNIISMNRLSYMSMFCEFQTYTMACHAMDRVNSANSEQSRLFYYTAELKTKEEIDEFVRQHDNDLQIVFNPSKCLCVHGLDPEKDNIDSLLQQFKLDGPYEIKDNCVYTYHMNAASVRDFYIAFQKHNCGIPNTYVTEESNRKVIQKICQILHKKLIADCITDVSNIFVMDAIIHAMQRTKLEMQEEEAKRKLEAKAQQNNENAIVSARNFGNKSRRRPKSPIEGPIVINFYLGSRKELNFYLSRFPKNTIIAPLIKKETKKRKKQLLHEDSTTYERDLSKQMEYETTFDSIKQPEIQNSSSRLTPVHRIEEWHKRNYLRPYAAMRRRKYILARKSGLPILQSQFTENDSAINRGVVAKRVYFEKSEIQGYGLFALEPISPKDFICYYTGQLVRMEVADRRERKLEKKGFQHMYNFRMGEYVIDATDHGSNARFLNHSCSPNCRSRQIFIQDMQAISFFATKAIKPHDEIAFDYEMELERDPAKWEKCYCNSKNCNGYLNYSIQTTQLNRMWLQSNSLLEDSDDSS